MILVQIATTTSPVLSNPDQASTVGSDANGARIAIAIANGEAYFASDTPAEVAQHKPVEQF